VKLALPLALCAVCAASCSEPASPPPDGALASRRASHSGATLSPPLELGPLMERARLAFHDVGGRLEGGDLHYRAAIDGAGLTFTAYHQPPARPMRTGAPLVLAPARASRGRALAGRAGPPARSDDGGVAIDRGWAQEELVNRAEGVEQRWRFERAPPGEGALVIRVAAPDLTLLAEDEQGLHLAPARGELGLVYGHGTWIDDAGERAPIAARWEDGAITLEVSEAVLRRTRWPAVLDPIIGPEVGPGVSTYVAAAGTQLGSDIAFSSSGGLAVWRDNRRGVYDVFATRVVSGGVTPLDPAGLLVSELGSPVGSVAVEHGAGVYLVAWTQSGRVLGRRIAPSGVFSDATPFVIRSAPAATFTSAIDVAFDGTDFVVAWSEGVGTEWDVLAARVTIDATVRDASPLVVCDAPGNQTNVVLAASGATIQAAWTDSRTDTGDVYGARIVAGAVLDAPGVPLATGAGYQGVPDLTIGAGTMLLGWQETDLGVLRIVALDGTGRPSGAPRIIASGSVSALTLASHPTGHLAVWQQLVSGERVVYATPLAASGGSGGSTIEVRRASTISPEEMVFSGGSYILTTSLGGDLFGHRLFTSGGGASSILLSSAAPSQGTGRIAESGGNYLLVWAVDRGAGDEVDVLGMRIDGTGSVIDPTPLEIAGGDNHQNAPALAGDGLGGWLVAWVSRRPASGSSYFTDVRARNVTASGAMSSSFDIARGGVVDSPSVGGGPSGYVVVYRDYDEVGARRVSRTGGPAGSSVVLGTMGLSRFDAAAVFDGAGFQLAWIEDFTIRGARMDTSGVVSPAGGREIVPPIGPTGSPISLALAAGGSSSLLAWTHQESTARQFVRFVRLDASGVPIGSPTVLTTGANALYPSATFEGTDFFVAFDRERTTTAVEGARITTASVARDPNGVLLRADALSSDLASGGDGRALLLYRGFHIGPTTNTRLLRASVIDFTMSGDDPVGATCDSSWTCASGHCADGVCCESACGGGVSDCQVCSSALGASADGVCTVVPAGLECRGARSVCDVAEACDGASGSCPEDRFVAAGTSCGAAATDVCDVDDVCTGASAFCATTARVPAGTECRASMGPCDPAEVCGGTAACPADARRSAGEVCRPAAGDCDLDDVCDGIAPACPSDTFVAAGTTCRASQGECDRREACDGRSPACPPDVRVPAGTACRAADGPCDVAESCDGAAPRCPPDEVQGAGTICRPASGACDLDDACDGTSTECAADRVRPRGFICRAASGACDVAEACDGAHPLCSIDRHRVDGSSCDDALLCNGQSACEAGECVEGEPLACEPGTECIEVLGECQAPVPAGCGCSAPGSRRAPALAVVGLLGLLGLLRRRR